MLQNPTFQLSPTSEGAPVDAIRNAIRIAVVERRLAPGTKLTESEIGELFDVSRTLVREALQALTYEGLVTVEKNRGAFVAHPQPEEARQIFAARRMVEPQIVTEAIAKATPEDLETLRSLLAIEAELGQQSGTLARRAEINASGDFHISIAAIARNQVMAKFMDELVARSSLVIALYGQSTVSSCGHQEHMSILDAFERKDVGRAQELMIHHLAHIEHDLDFQAKKGLGLKAALTR